MSNSTIRNAIRLTLLRFDEEHGFVGMSIDRRIAHTKRMLLYLRPTNGWHRYESKRVRYHLVRIGERLTHAGQLASPDPASS